MAKAWHLVRRPQAMPVMADFALRDLPAGPLEEGQIRIRNHWLSVDPYMRGRMNDQKSYFEPFALDAPMTGGAVGRVIESRNPAFAKGDLVFHMGGWRDEAVGGRELMANVLPATGLPDQTWLHNLGLTGGTAWIGLLDVAAARPGETVFVSAAAGAVGSAVVQIAKARGMTVIGSAGGPEKCDFVRGLGADAVIDYKAGPVLGQLHKAAPQGIDVYFDNVGGEHLDAAFALARDNARFAICGMIEAYNDGRPQELRYFIRTIPARIRIAGFIYTDHADRFPAFLADMGQMIAAGQVTARETVREGLEAMPQAFFDLFTGANIGKMLVKLG